MINLNIHPYHLYGAGGHVDKHEGSAHHLSGWVFNWLITSYSFNNYFQTNPIEFFCQLKVNLNIHLYNIYLHSAGGHVDEHVGGAYHVSGGVVQWSICTYLFPFFPFKLTQ